LVSVGVKPVSQLDRLLQIAMMRVTIDTI